MILFFLNVESKVLKMSGAFIRSNILHHRRIFHITAAKNRKRYTHTRHKLKFVFLVLVGLALSLSYALGKG
jgi:Na+/H+ antiporter NhaD/arsenite permease-like protein